MNRYQSIAAPVTDILHKDSNSKFIGYAYPVQHEEDIKERLAEIKVLHPKATHHCYAWRLGLDQHHFRVNDDGEPAGTAGRPILGQIDSLQLTNCLVLVVRYYGGTKLGVPGLIDAYKTCARLTLEQATVKHYQILDYYRVNCAYTSMQQVYRFASALPYTIVEQQIDNDCQFLIAIEQNLKNKLELTFREAQLDFTFVGRK